MGELYVLKGELTERTLTFLKDVEASLEKVLPHFHVEIAKCLCNIGRIELFLKQYKDAKINLDECANIARELLLQPRHSLVLKVAKLLESASVEVLSLNNQ